MGRALTLFFFLPLLLPAFAWGQNRGIGLVQKADSPFLKGQFRALVIGNDAYRDPERLWGSLKTAVNDAKAVAATLEKDYRFGDVRLLVNATRRQMIQAFNELAGRTEENDSVLVFYAGHGYLRESTGEGFWIPVDAEGRDDSTYVPNAVIKTKVSVIADRARHVLLVSDSCFSGDLLRRGNRGARLDEKNEGYYRKMALRKSAQVLAAGGLEFVDDNYKGTGHSPFTYYFLKELSYNIDPLLEATDLSQAVTRNVSNNAEQTPVKGVLQGAGDEGGEFFFIRSDVVTGWPPGGTKVATLSPEFPPTQEKGQHALALAAPFAPIAATTSAGGGISLGLLGGGVGLGLLSLQQYMEALDKNDQAQATAQSDPEGSQRLEDERDTAALYALLAGAAGVALTVWAFSDGGEEGTSRTDEWGVMPVVVAREGGAMPGMRVRLNW